MQLSVRGPTRIARLLALIGALAFFGCQGQAPPGAIAEGDVRHALEVLAAAPEQGLTPEPFDVAGIPRLGRSPADRPARDRALHDALIAYARAQHGLTVPAGAMPKDWGLRPGPYDAEAELRQAVAQHRFRAWLDALPPPSPAYHALQQAYVRYLKVQAAGGWPTISAGPPLRPGARGPRVEALRQRLAAEDPGVTAASPGAAFDPALAEAVVRFQSGHGLEPTGQVDAVTLRELNYPAVARAGQIRANLERLRWLPRDEPATRVDVNTAAGVFDYYNQDRLALHMLAAAGKPGDETPMLASAIDAVVLNPPWNVPDEIARAELYPKEQANPGYFAAHGFETVAGEGGAERLVQTPSPQSALGLVKFEFKNAFSVYLHDTPSKAAFDRAQRSVSHGCVRLEKAVAFAQLLLSADAGWTPERLQQAIASGETQTVTLHHKVPVRLLYFTAFPEGSVIAFRPDVYGWDNQLLQMLDRASGHQVARAPRTAGPTRA
jgi:murein L,D-transpeptidase YcbB/YkuD